MAIQLYCQACRAYAPVTAKKCGKCGEVFPREGRKYRVDVCVKGKRFYRFADNLTIARELEASIKSDVIRGEYDITHHKAKKSLTLGDLWEKYLPWAREHKKTWKDDEWYYRKHIEPRFKSKALDAITPFDIEKMKTELKKGINARGRPFAPQTIKHQIVILRRLYNLARKWGLYDGKSPVESVQMPKVDNQKTEYLRDEEAERLLAVLDTWPFKDTAAFIKFAMFTGLRRGELFKLTWDDVDFDRGMVTLRDPKGGKSQTIPVCSPALDVLRELDVVSTFVFPGKDGKQRTDFKGPWGRIRKAAGLPEGFRFHGLRHHYASTLVSNGVDLAVVKELLTHKDMTTTQRYAHLRPDAVKRAAEKAGELLNAKGRGKVLKIAD
ncbi:MAG: site-specific integrase [Deltaproteobacteria bacterium]|nr:site-specific integrase [Deltaproteobacteria bacterium]